jgi:arsenite methyltransferase
VTETGTARDLMRSAEIKEIVRSAYAAVDDSSEIVARKLYAPEELAQVPQSAIEGALGVGNHLRHAQIDAGETLLDLGCGAGIDTILAAQRTGPTGHVIALDFLPEMLERTKTAAAEAGLANVAPLASDPAASSPSPTSPSPRKNSHPKSSPTPPPGPAEWPAP